MKGIRGIRVWRRALGEECSEHSNWLGVGGCGGAEEEAACPPRDRPPPLGAFWMAAPFLGKQSLSGERRGEKGGMRGGERREEERRGRPWRQTSCVSEDPQSRRLQKKRLRSEGERIRKKRKEKKSKK